MTTPSYARPFVWRDGAGRPPLLMLHGTGGDEHDLMPLAELLSPTSPVLSPRGTVLENGAPRFFRRLRPGLFDEKDLADQAQDLTGFVRQVGAEHGLTEGQFVAIGFSNGANIASAIMLTHPEELAGAVLIAAMIPFRKMDFDTDLTGKWVVIANGRNDPTIPLADTARLADRLRDLGAQVHLLEHDGGHSIDPTQHAQIAAIIGDHQPT